MDRREFVKFIAASAAGTALLPAQLAALEKYYDLNTPPVATGLVAVDQVLIGGNASQSVPAVFSFGFGKDRISTGVNFFGGIYMWNAKSDMKMIGQAHEFTWLVDRCEPSDFTGTIRYIDQLGVRRYKEIAECRGSLA